MSTNSNRSLINLAILFFCLASLLYNVGALQIVGLFLLIMVIILLTVISVSNRKMIINQRKFLLILIYLAVIYFFGLIKGVSFRSIEVFVCLGISIIVLNTFAVIDFATINSKIVKYLFFFEISVLFLPYLLGTGFNPIDGGYKSIFTTTTFLGIFSCMQIELCLLIYIGKRRMIWLFFIPFFASLVWLSMVRTAYVGLIIIILCFLFRRVKLLHNKKTLWLSKWALFVIIATIVIIYPQLQSYDWYEAVSSFVYMATGKILMSGRNEVWEEGFRLISNNPIWGYGLDTSFFDIQLHNSYLELMLESGVMGIIGVFLLLNCVLNKIIDRSLDNKTIYFFTLVNLLMCTTEVMLLHGQMVLQIMTWGIMGAGLNNVNTQKIEKSQANV